MINAVSLYQIRHQALAWSMQTASAGEDVLAIMTRAHVYMNFLLEPLEKAEMEQLMRENQAAIVH